ncbi:sulfotransferase [Pseudomonas sp. NPDC086581]|uniref:sulfotransferase n=1 Tax=Pseudomonas sp. NPDC086581 TaxID=3364432 RepID=UPI003809E66A
MQDDQLIFMISLPRSGSTLLQRILGGHSEIYTRSEPWLMLHSLFALRTEGIQARYNAQVAAAGVQDFISNMPEKDESYYYSQIRDCYLSLYGTYLSGSGKRCFLDKTPRYYEVFDELQKTFPNAKFIILYRNPLAVLASMLETWVKGNYRGLKDYRSDLYDGVEFLQRDFSRYSNTHLVKYEDLLLDADCKVEEIFKFLKLPNQPECIDYGNNPGERWKYGDPVTIYKKSRPDAQHANGWHKQLAVPESRKLLFDYLQILGRPAFERLGYSFDDALRVFASSEPSESDCAPKITLSLANLLLADSEIAQRAHQRNAKLQQDIKALELRCQEAQQQLSEARAEHQQDSGLIQELSTRVKNLEGLLGSRDLQIQARDEQIGLRDAQIRNRDGQIAERDTQLSDRDRQIAVRDALLGDRDEQINARDAQLRDRDEQIANRDALLNRRTAELAKRDAQLQAHEERSCLGEIQLQERNEQISVLVGQLKERDQQVSIRDTQMEEQSKTLSHRNALLNERDEQLRARDIRVGELSEQIERASQQIVILNDALGRQEAELASYAILASESQMKLEESSLQSRQLEGRLSLLVEAAERLTARRVLRSPRYKINAYRNLLESFASVREFMRATRE